MDSGYVFQIVDTGIGIVPKDIPKALSRFGQVEGDLNRQYEGTGLGLPLTTARRTARRRPRSAKPSLRRNHRHRALSGRAHRTFTARRQSRRCS